MSDSIDLLVIPKPGGEELRLQLAEYRGHRFINARVFYNAGGGEMRPGRQGCTFPLWALPDIREALERAEAIVAGEVSAPASPSPAHRH